MEKNEDDDGEHLECEDNAEWAIRNPQGPEHELRAGLHVPQHVVHAHADGLEDLAEIGLQDQQGESELQSQPPAENAELDVFLMRRK
jgi:hypothetical protein